MSTSSELIPEIHAAVSSLTQSANALEADQFNAVPYPDSWTPGQLLRHVSKSIKGIAKEMDKPGEPAERDPAARVAELQKVFLDFTHKMKSPEFIVPEEKHYDKQTSLEELSAAEALLAKNAANANGSELVKDLPFGPVTKFELMNFVLFHTQRHVHQMNKMMNSLV